MPQSNRRRFLKGAGAIGIGGFISGCTGGGGGDSTPEPTEEETTESGGGGGSPTPTPSQEERWEEWRKEKSREAEKEGGLNVITSIPEWRDAVVNHDFEGDLYEPLNQANIRFRVGGAAEMANVYQREVQAGQESTDCMIEGHTHFLLDELADISHIPGFQQQPDAVKVPPKMGALGLSGGGLAYNTERVEQAPESYQDLLRPEFADGEIVIDFTPPAMKGYGTMDKAGEDTLRRIARDQNAALIKSLSTSSQRIANGDFKAGPMLSSNHVPVLGENFDGGQPIDYVIDPDVHAWTHSKFGHGQYPANPATADLFMDYCMAKGTHSSINAPFPGAISVYGDDPNKPRLSQCYGGGRIYTPVNVPLTGEEISAKWQEIIGYEGPG